MDGGFLTDLPVPCLPDQQLQPHFACPRVIDLTWLGVLLGPFPPSVLASFTTEALENNGRSPAAYAQQLDGLADLALSD